MDDDLPLRKDKIFVYSVYGNLEANGRKSLVLNKLQFGRGRNRIVSGKVCEPPVEPTTLCRQ